MVRGQGVGVRGQEERGAALIVVLGLVAIVAGWAAAAAYEDMLSLRRASNSQYSIKAEMACISALRLAELTLREDGKQSQTDDLDEIWAQPATPFPLDDGMVMGEIVDTNRYLNLNDLVTEQGVLNSYSYAVFGRLFTALDIDPALLPALVDWMDADDRALDGGMESVSYELTGYTIKNARLDRWDELRMVPGFSRDIMEKLKTVATVRPAYAGVRTLININTASKTVLKALFPLLDDAQADRLISDRPYRSTGVLQGRSWMPPGGLTQLAVSSDMFFIHTQASFAQVNRRETYLIARQGSKLTMIWREWDIWQP